jgi:hypothetical protein
VKINYNEELIGRIQSQNADLFQNVFGGSIVNSADATTDKSEEEMFSIGI